MWIKTVGLSLTPWLRDVEDTTNQSWLRWCDRSGQVIPTGAEGQKIAQQQAEQLEALL